MNKITTVGELKAVLTGLPDTATVRPNLFPVSLPQDGVYVIRYVAGTCNPEYVEIAVQRQ